MVGALGVAMGRCTAAMHLKGCDLVHASTDEQHQAAEKQHSFKQRCATTSTTAVLQRCPVRSSTFPLRA
jgi:hypothetical protein